MKKIIIILFTLCALSGFTTCETLQGAFKEPVVSLQSVEMANINITNVQLLCKVAVENKNSMDIPFPETGWEVFLNSNSFISGVVKNNQKIKARKSTVVEIPVTLNYVDIFKTFMSLKGTKETAYKVALAVKIPLPLLGDKIWNLQHQGILPIVQLPKISAPTMRIENRDNTKVEILASITVENPNRFPIPSPKFSYDYQLNRASFLKGDVENKEPLASSSSTPVNFRMVVNYADLARSVASSLLTGNTSLTSLLKVTGDMKIPAFTGEGYSREISGTLPLR